MVGLSIAFGLVVLVGGVLIAAGLMGGGNSLLLALGFIIFAACAIYGVQPGFLGPDRTDDRR